MISHAIFSAGIHDELVIYCWFVYFRVPGLLHELQGDFLWPRLLTKPIFVCRGLFYWQCDHNNITKILLKVQRKPEHF